MKWSKLECFIFASMITSRGPSVAKNALWRRPMSTGRWGPDSLAVRRWPPDGAALPGD